MEEMTNPFAARYATRQKSIKNRNTRIQKMLQSGEKSQSLGPIEHIKDSADQYQKQNPELKAKILVLLREYIKPSDSKEEILKKVMEFYPDVSLADEALDFLLETTEGELHLTVQEAKKEFNKLNAREILAGRNIGTVAREAAEKGLGTPTTMRDMYRDITGNPRDSGTLFDELSRRYNFKELKKVISFLLHSLGADLKAKGSSIDRGLLHRLITETRSLQAILGVYHFFRTRMGLVETLFAQNELDLPPQLTFELLAKQFMVFVSDRYPSADKALQLSVKLGIEKWLIAKIIVLSQLRDAIREVSVNQIYKSIQHRDDSYMALIEALEDLEDELEELEDSERDQEDNEEEDSNNEDTE
jgi:type III secretion protein W